MKKSYRTHRIDSLFDYYPLAPLVDTATNRDRLNTWAKNQGQTTRFTKLVSEGIPKVVSNNHAIGVEIEVEQMHTDFTTSLPLGWSGTGDNSLRSGGFEFVSSPVSPEFFRHIYSALLLHLRHSPCDLRPPKFSWRTSIHVHLNVRNETVENVFNLLLLYILFEDSFFSFVGEDRRANNFCVPLTETNLSETISELFQASIGLKDLLRCWQKYTAVNPRPIFCNDHGETTGGQHDGKGTIEFRQLAGTYDANQVITWINLILCLQNYSRYTSLDNLEDRIVAISCKQDYVSLFEEVFGSLTEHMPVGNRDFNRIM